MERTLSPREAADLLGITVETLRRWESEGAVRSVRTPGGQRRFTERELRRVLKSGRSRERDNLSADSQASVGGRRLAGEADTVRVPSVAPTPIPPWERRVREEQAELAVTRIRQERDALLRAERETAREREQREAAQAASARSQEEAQTRRAAEAATEATRLAKLRDYGASLARSAPPEYQVRVVQDLRRFVSSDEVPPTLTDFLAREHIRARVDGILKAWREQEAKEVARAASVQRRRSLLESGRLHATLQTFSWDSGDAQRARREVERVLSAEVESDWTIEDVRDLVDDVLDEWEEE